MKTLRVISKVRILLAERLTLVTVIYKPSFPCQRDLLHHVNNKVVLRKQFSPGIQLDFAADLVLPVHHPVGGCILLQWDHLVLALQGMCVN